MRLMRDSKYKGRLMGGDSVQAYDRFLLESSEATTKLRDFTLVHCDPRPGIRILRFKVLNFSPYIR